MKVILLNHQNDFVGTLKIMNNAAKNFDILTTSLSVPHNYLVEQNYFSDPAKNLNLSAFSPCS